MRGLGLASPGPNNHAEFTYRAGGQWPAATRRSYPALALHYIDQPGEAAVKSAMRQSKPGLTLVEVVMGVVILAILAAIAIPAFYTMLQRSQLDAGVRQMMGKTNPRDSPPGTIRGDLGIDLSRNVVHGSDSPTSASREISIFFKESEILTYERQDEAWLYP